MRRAHNALVVTIVSLLSIVAIAVAPDGGQPVRAEGVGGATWTPSRSTTTDEASRFLLDGDSITFRTDATWDAAQAAGLARYEDDGLRYTLEINDRSGRLSATGYWATNHPDPAYDRDDDDRDGRWEEAEIIAGSERPETGRTYTSLMQFSRWHAKRQRGECGWAWDRRLGGLEVLSQLSRNLLGEWQAERYTLDYQDLQYPRVGLKPALDGEIPRARCHERRPGRDQHGFVVTFSRPLAYDTFLAMPRAGSTRWTAFEAIGSSEADELTWTCGGPVTQELGLRPCRSMGMRPQGVVAATGYLTDAAVKELEASPDVARVEGLQDSLTGLLYDVGGFGVEPPDLTVNDRYWELFLNE